MGLVFLVRCCRRSKDARNPSRPEGRIERLGRLCATRKLASQHLQDGGKQRKYKVLDSDGRGKENDVMNSLWWKCIQWSTARWWYTTVKRPVPEVLAKLVAVVP